MVGIGMPTISAAKYGTERLWATWGPATLAPGPTAVLSLSGWGTTTGDKLLRLRRLAVTQNAGVQVIYRTDTTESAGGAQWTDGYPAGWRAAPLFVQARQSLSVSLNNSSGAAVDAFQLNVALDIIRLQHGDVPPLLEVQRQQTWDPARLSDPPESGSWHLNAGASGQQSAVSMVVPSTEVWVLDALAVPGAPICQVAVNRDGDIGYMTVNGAAFVQTDNAPWDVWIPATKTLQVQVTGGTGVVPVYLHVSRYRLTPALQHLLGLTQ
jgi:hypothetical protein